MKRKHTGRWVTVGIVLAVIIGGVFMLSRSKLAVASDDIPSGLVKRGDLEIKVHGEGELSASHTMMLTAPAVGGGSLQITRLENGRLPVRKGDTIIEFDPSEQRYKMEQNRSDLLQADQEMIKARADAAVLAAQDKVALLKARYAVRQAELDVQKNEISSGIDAAKNNAALKEAQRLLTDLEGNIQTHTASGQASVYLAREKYNKAKLAMDQAQQNIDKMKVTAPMDGSISVQKNVDAAGGMMFTGMFLPDYRAGDEAQPGSAIAQVVDPGGIELKSAVSESEHANIKQGQAVEVSFDALPGRAYHGKIKTVGGMSAHDIFEGPQASTFDVVIEVTDADARLRSGMTAQLTFLGDVQKNVLYVPRQALFLKDGKHILYVKHGKDYQQQEVKIQSETESRAVIEGMNGSNAVADGSQVAMIDPTVPRKAAATGASAAPGGGTP